MNKFGNALRTLRRRRHETLAEISGAIELDINKLDEIEAGKLQPSEETVLLLISHFSLKEDEAVSFWQLAGYDQSRFGVYTEDNLNEQNAFVAPSDSRILYTDMVHVSVNNYGVVVNFLQGMGMDGKPLVVSRVGMSREHANSLIDVLQRTVRMADAPKQQQQKQLPEVN